MLDRVGGSVSSHGLRASGTIVEGAGVELTVRFSKREGIPVRFVPADDPRQAAAVREVDLECKYYMSATEFARTLDLTAPRALALRRHLAIDEHDDDRHVFVFDSQRIPSLGTRQSRPSLVSTRLSPALGFAALVRTR